MRSDISGAVRGSVDDEGTPKVRGGEHDAGTIGASGMGGDCTGADASESIVGGAVVIGADLDS